MDAPCPDPDVHPGVEVGLVAGGHQGVDVPGNVSPGPPHFRGVEEEHVDDGHLGTLPRLCLQAFEEGSVGLPDGFVGHPVVGLGLQVGLADLGEDVAVPAAVVYIELPGPGPGSAVGGELDVTVQLGVGAVGVRLRGEGQDRVGAVLALVKRVHNTLYLVHFQCSTSKIKFPSIKY